MTPIRDRGRVVIVALLMLAAVRPTPVLADCPPDLSSPQPTALVLSGGGAKGAWEAGLAYALVQAGLPIRLIAGSSAGALNAVMLADGRLDRLEATWRGLSREQIYRLRPSIVLGGLLPGWLTLLTLDRARSLFDPDPLRDLITSSLDLERVRASPIQLVLVAVDLERRITRIFDNRSVTVEALMAVTAVPGAFPAVEVDGALLVDGGLTGRAPILEALHSGVPLQRAIVALSYLSDERGQRPTTLRRTLEQAFETSMVHQIERDVELARFKHPRVAIHVVRPSRPLALRPLEFDGAGLARAFVLGRSDGQACLRASGG
jgi:NTE family protein